MIGFECNLHEARFLTLISSFSVYLIQLFAVVLTFLSLSRAAVLNSFFASSNLAIRMLDQGLGALEISYQFCPFL